MAASPLPPAVELHAQGAPTVIPGFTPLLYPRTTLPIGAEWTSTGPIGRGLPESARLVERAYAEVVIDAHDTNAQAFRASIFGLAGVSRDKAKDQERKLVLKDVEIVSVRDAGKLAPRPGRAYLWSAIRVGSIAMDLAQSELSGAQASLTSNLPRAVFEIGANVKRDKTARVTISNFDCYLGVTVRSWSDTSVETLAVGASDRLVTAFDLGEDVSLSFASLNSRGRGPQGIREGQYGTSTVPNRCRGMLVLRVRNPTTGQVVPAESAWWRVLCEASSSASTAGLDGAYSTQFHSEGDRWSRYTLHVMNSSYSVGLGGVLAMAGRAALTRRTLEPEFVVVHETPQWVGGANAK